MIVMIISISHLSSPLPGEVLAYSTFVQQRRNVCGSAEIRGRLLYECRTREILCTSEYKNQKRFRVNNLEMQFFINCCKLIMIFNIYFK
jgi:hypothetical protein